MKGPKPLPKWVKELSPMERKKFRAYFNKQVYHYRRYGKSFHYPKTREIWDSMVKSERNRWWIDKFNFVYVFIVQPIIPILVISAIITHNHKLFYSAIIILLFTTILETYLAFRERSRFISSFIMCKWMVIFLMILSKHHKYSNKVINVVLWFIISIYTLAMFVYIFFIIALISH